MATRERCGVDVGAGSEPVIEAVGDGVIARLTSGRSARAWCPDHLLHLQEPPADPDDVVAHLRWCLAWELDHTAVSMIARRARVDAGRIMAFLEAPARQAGDLLTFDEAARLVRYTGQRLVDRESIREAADNWQIAEPYLEMSGLHVGRAIRQAKAALRVYRARKRPQAAG